MRTGSRLPRILPEQFDQLLIDSVPSIDVRAPIEFIKGAVPESCNLPLLTDKEREKVGTCYKQQGREQAIELGHSLVNGATKLSRLENWQQFLARNKNAYLYCYRGGLRSRITAEWLAECGITVPVIEGGYQALRQHLLNEFDAISPDKLLVISGMTGCGKTPLIKPFNNAIDLEGIANHRGSSFGKKVTPQPSQINFENRLAVEFIKRRNCDPVILEDESRLIGRNFLPLPLQKAMKQCDIILVNEPLGTRVERIFQEYVVDMSKAFAEDAAVKENQPTNQLANQEQTDDGFEAFSNYLVKSVTVLSKRLGKSNRDRLVTMQQKALLHQQQTQDYSMHRDWIVSLLADYYDPIYTYQLSKKKKRMVFSGSYQQVSEYLSEQTEKQQAFG
ncbi:tRNA 2-selenouridine(34) synthase MnmH [Pleionea mediterranea]|uniref:tRNA 2-selenouridine synthase n=1 Tax=Pleionea mediterranea TaxID=523701 RepID=A0A316GEC1_9GAMM|nr:tRNA 2-selenouridine(34) synthase MnmH [Pleionea mediterranea]PWK53007.1 tRNA 2-selenouridine synthase [Pleionea mediterranea]